MAEKKLTDITRRQFLKGAAKVAGATALPGSGLASIGEAVEKPLTINQKLDLTKNVMEQLSKLKVTPRQNKILLFLENEYYRRESNKRASLKEKGKTYVPLNIAKKAIKEAYQNSKEYKQTMNKLEDLNSQFKDAMKELGDGFEELSKIKF